MPLKNDKKQSLLCFICKIINIKNYKFLNLYKYLVSNAEHISYNKKRKLDLILLKFYILLILFIYILSNVTNF